MDNKSAVIITGANGGLGIALCRILKAEGFLIIGTDNAKVSDPGLYDLYIEEELIALLEDSSAQTNMVKQVTGFLLDQKAALTGLINNAATQILGGVDTLTIPDLEQSLKVNVTAPYLLVTLFVDQLQENNGTVINIGSIHSRLTKPGFVGYATSKAAIAGLTRALAIDLEGRIQVNCIEPAALETDMLKAGFVGNEEGYKQLAKCHPSGVIGQPEEVAELCAFIMSGKSPFINGATISIDGGISGRLHDPV